MRRVVEVVLDNYDFGSRIWSCVVMYCRYMLKERRIKPDA